MKMKAVCTKCEQTSVL